MVQRVKAALLARVSREEQVEGYSLDAQARAFREMVEQRDWDTYHEYVEEGRSAHTENVRNRPVFLEAINDALAGRYDVLIVHKIDRFSRKLRITLEYFEKLGKAGVGFMSLHEQIDYSTPQGKFMLVMQGGLAELYSDNLGQEVKKGLHERRKQGMYLGLLPFGAGKGEDGIPVRHPETYDGLDLAFGLAGEGKSDREVARALNARGFRTAGNQGNRLFSKDTVRGMLTNKFYVGQISNGEGGWLSAKHEPLIRLEAFKAAQEARNRNRNFSARNTRGDARVSALSGVTRCFECGSTLRTMRNRGVARLVCNTRLKRGGCSQKSARVDRYEDEILHYLETFHIPEDYQQLLLESRRQLEQAYNDTEAELNRLNGALERLTELYKWGDIDRSKYLLDSREIQAQLDSLVTPDNDTVTMERFAQFLQDVPSAWRQADEAQRNKLARTLFDAVWINDQAVLGITPRPELKPFFELNSSNLSNDVLQWRPRPDSNRRSLP